MRACRALRFPRTHPEDIRLKMDSEECAQALALRRFANVVSFNCG